MDEMPKPVAWFRQGARVNFSFVEFPKRGGEDLEPLFTASQVAELMDRAASIELHHGEYEGHTEAGLIHEFRRLYCKGQA